jgi:hypothetical protein
VRDAIDDCMIKDLRFAIVGCLLSTAVGDALGLPYEGFGDCVHPIVSPKFFNQLALTHDPT